MSKAKSEYAIQTVTNALRLLEAFHEEDELGVSELSRRLALHKNNVFRLLATLEQAGYIEQSTRSERYRLGASCLRLGQAFGCSHTLLRRARPILREISSKLGETSHVAVLRDFEVVHLDGDQPQGLLMTSLRVGQRLPVHCTALGKVLLGCAGKRVHESYDREGIAGRPLVARTQATIVDRDKLFEHLRSVASQGFALDLEECERGLACVAAPVLDASGGICAALSISAPAARLDEDALLREIVPLVTSAAERLSQELGYTS